MKCREYQYNFSQNRSLFEYRGIAREMIYQYKARGRRRVGRIMADLLGVELNKNFNSLPVIPVPPRSGLLKHSPDHLDPICRLLMSRYGIRIFRCLQRSGTVQQKTLDVTARIKNIRGHISLRLNPPPDMLKVVVLDDIFTTGATLDECARILASAGIREVQTLTFAQD